VAVVLGFLLQAVRPIAWTVGFGASGTLCVVNAIRSKRFHCAFTGPLFLLGAALTIARASGLLTVSWMVIGWGVVTGVLGFLVIEMVTGKRRIGRCC
jgi:hypothetical protein